jgi:hypothetical protein
MNDRPWTVGAIRGADGFPKERVQLAQQRVSQATNLTDLAVDYHFYTPALMYLHLRLMGREPFHDFLAEYKRPVVPISLKFDKPVFKGLEIENNPIWNHYLYGIEHEHFLPYLTWLGSLTISDVEKGFVARLRYREIQIADPLYLGKIVTTPKEVPMVKLVAFCLDTNRGCYYIDPAIDPLLDLATSRYTTRSFDDTVRFAQAVLTGNRNPYGLIEQGQAKDGLSVEEQEVRRRVSEERSKQNGSSGGDRLPS